MHHCSFHRWLTFPAHRRRGSCSLRVVRLLSVRITPLVGDSDPPYGRPCFPRPFARRSSLDPRTLRRGLVQGGCMKLVPIRVPPFGHAYVVRGGPFPRAPKFVGGWLRRVTSDSHGITSFRKLVADSLGICPSVRARYPNRWTYEGRGLVGEAAPCVGSLSV